MMYLKYQNTETSAGNVLWSNSDKQGTITNEQRFDPWGRRVKKSDFHDYNVTTTLDPWLIRGFTGHEHLDYFELINMNNRMYDPVLGRMCAVDNFVADPTSLAGYNRYTYANNNPLKFVDPSGEVAWFVPLLIGAGVGAYFGGAIQQGGGGIANANFNPFGGNSGAWNNTAWKGMAVGAMIGAAAGAFVSAAAGFAPSAGVTGFKTWGVTTSAIKGANVNMAITENQGGSWDQAWRSGIVGAASGAYTATGGFGLVKRGFVGRLAYQGLGSTGRSIGNNWARGDDLLTRFTLGLGLVNLTVGKRQRLLRWENNIGNIAMNAFGIANLAFGGTVDPNWEHLTPVYKGGIIDKIYDPSDYPSGFSPFVVTGNSEVDELMNHEMHHVWQSRSMGDAFAGDFILQGILSVLIGGGTHNSDFVSENNYYEYIPYEDPWW